MATLGRSPGAAPLTSADIPDDSITGAKVVDDAIDSEHYAAGSVDNPHLADDAVGVAELSATGTAGATTFLRGDNAWATPAGSPVGMIAPFAMASPPTGWIACDGAAVSRTTTYDTLFGVISTTWGVGDGSSTFNVPDLEGAFLRGTGSHAASNMADGSDYAGPSLGAFEDDQFQGHTHDTYGTMWHGNSSSGWYVGSGSANGDRGGFDLGAPEVKDHGTERTGDETRPFNAGVKYCIKY